MNRNNYKTLNNYLHPENKIQPRNTVTKENFSFADGLGSCFFDFECGTIKKGRQGVCEGVKAPFKMGRCKNFEGKYCKENADCQNNMCINYSCGKKNNGIICLKDSDCKSGFCGSSSKCDTKKEDGKQCKFNIDCVSNNCFQTICRTPKDCTVQYLFENCKNDYSTYTSEPVTTTVSIKPAQYGGKCNSVYKHGEKKKESYSCLAKNIINYLTYLGQNDYNNNLMTRLTTKIRDEVKSINNQKTIFQLADALYKRKDQQFKNDSVTKVLDYLKKNNL
jgi:hypothetical protein